MRLIVGVLFLVPSVCLSQAQVGPQRLDIEGVNLEVGMRFSVARERLVGDGLRVAENPDSPGLHSACRSTTIGASATCVLVGSVQVENGIVIEIKKIWNAYGVTFQEAFRDATSQFRERTGPEACEFLSKADLENTPQILYGSPIRRSHIWSVCRRYSLLVTIVEFPLEGGGYHRQAEVEISTERAYP